MAVLGPVDAPGLTNWKSLSLSGSQEYTNPNGFLVYAAGAGNVSVTGYRKDSYETMAVKATSWLTIGGVFVVCRKIRNTGTTATGLIVGVNWEAVI